MLPDYTALLREIKRAAKEVYEASKPTQVCYGEVTSDSPLKIQVDQKLVLEEEQLVLCRTVTDYECDVEFSLKTENYSTIIQAYTAQLNLLLCNTRSKTRRK